MEKPPTKIEGQYPLDPTELKTVYSNHVSIQYTPEEVYLDFGLTQTQLIRPEDVDEKGAVTKVPALMQVRVVLTREHAKRLVHAVSQGIKAFEETR